MNLHESLIECAQQEGFPLAGTVDLEVLFSKSSNLFQAHVDHFDRWLSAGYSGAMEYLKRGRDRRADPRLLFPAAKSILCVAIPYPRNPAGNSSAMMGPRYARYLQGKDYHLQIHEKLEQVMQSVKAQWALNPQNTELTWKICVDTSAVLERSWAALAGLGWIGKNTLLIHPKLGSYLFLAEVLLNQNTHQEPSPLPDLCGHCTRCLEGCPTQAFEAPHLLNSNRCLSYGTLEHRGALQLPEIETKVVLTENQSWVAGCDRCQEVCPFNFKPSREVTNHETARNATELNSWVELLQESSEDYRLRVKDSAMKRIKPAQFSRNLAYSLLNASRDITDDQLLAFVNPILPLVLERWRSESDPTAKAEWEKCWNEINFQIANRTKSQAR